MNETKPFRFAGEGAGGVPSLFDFVSLTRRTPVQGVRCLQKLLWGMDYHFEEAGEFSLDNVRWRRRERGTAHVYAPRTPYWERCSAQDIPFRESYIVFRADRVLDLEALVAAGGGFARFRDDAGMLQSAFTELAGIPAGRRWRAQSIFFDILDFLVSAHSIGDGEYVILPKVVPRPPSMAERVDAYIRANYHLPLTLDGMAGAVGVSRSALTHRYREETGGTPFQRLTECRLSVARGMILRGESLKVVAEHTGFYDEYHFSKAFRRHFGQPPRRYARQSSLTAGWNRAE